MTENKRLWKIIFLVRVMDHKMTASMTMSLAQCGSFAGSPLLLSFPSNSQRRLQLSRDANVGLGLKAHLNGCSLLWDLTDRF